MPVLIWKGHMVVLEPPELSTLSGTGFYSRRKALRHLPWDSVFSIFFWHSRHEQPRTAPGRLFCRLCRTDRKAGELASSCRPHSCLPAVARMAAGSTTARVMRDLPRAARTSFGTGRVTEVWSHGGVALPPVEVFQRQHVKEGYL